MNEALLRELYQSLGQRRRPEEIAATVRHALAGGLGPETERALRAVARHARPAGWSSMSEEFARPVGMGRQLATASALFRMLEQPDDLNVVAIREYLETISARIAKGVGRSDFLRDRLNREQRQQVGLGTLSRRRYNKLFRFPFPRLLRSCLWRWSAAETRAREYSRPRCIMSCGACAKCKIAS